MMGVSIVARMTALALSDGSTLVHSPIALDDQALASLGHVSFVVGPNKFHHLFISQVVERATSASLWVTEGLARKRGDLKVSGMFGRDPWPLAGEVEAVLVEGIPALDEVVLFHHASKTLVVADTLMNIHARSFGQRLYARLSDVLERPNVPRLARMMLRDKGAARRSVERILDLTPSRLVLAHGQVVERISSSELRAAFGPLLGD